MVHGSWFRVNGELWFTVNGSGLFYARNKECARNGWKDWEKRMTATTARSWLFVSLPQRD
jgi:hypothetical protein